MRPLLLNGYSKEELLSTKYGDYQREENEDEYSFSTVIKSESLKGELDTIHKDGR
jgi:hypothetical protein